MEIPAKVALYVRKPEFLRWQDNPEEPRVWTGAARFLGLQGADAYMKPIERLDEIRSATQAALEWCRSQNIDNLISSRDFDKPIYVTDMTNLLDFLASLTYRFPEKFKGG